MKQREGDEKSSTAGAETVEAGKIVAGKKKMFPRDGCTWRGQICPGLRVLV
jgi:hypothetical protein